VHRRWGRIAALAALVSCRGRVGAPIGGAAARVSDAAASTPRDDVAAMAPPRGKKIALVYTSNVHGEYEHCGCPVHPTGGLARRAAEVDAVRADSDAVISVDAGDLFLPAREAHAGFRAPAASELERRARLIATAYARLGVTAFSPGEGDLALGAPLLARVLADAKVPVVSANLVDARGRALFAPDRIVDAAGVRVGIFGVTAVSPDAPARLRTWGVEARDPAAAARTEVASLRARGARIVVALVHVGGTLDSKRLVEAAPGIDWAVLGHSGLNLEAPEPVGGARMLEAMSMGKNLGVLELHVVAGDGAGPYADRGARAQLQTILLDHRHQIAEYEQRLAPAAPGQPDAGPLAPSLRAYYGKRALALELAIARETRALADMPARVSGNWFDNRIVPLDTAVPDQPGVGTLVAAYNRQSERLAAAGKPVGIQALPPDEPPPPPHVGPAADAPAVEVTYEGAAACAACHEPAVDFWRTTKHAHALATLEKAHRARDPACIGCHVTGYFQPGGTTDLEVATSRLADVGCEACHGPASAHVAAADKKAFPSTVPASVCLGCHTPDQTNNGFDYPSFVAAITGPGHARSP